MLQEWSRNTSSIYTKMHSFATFCTKFFFFLLTNKCKSYSKKPSDNKNHKAFNLTTLNSFQFVLSCYEILYPPTSQISGSYFPRKSSVLPSKHRLIIKLPHRQFLFLKSITDIFARPNCFAHNWEGGTDTQV